MVTPGVGPKGKDGCDDAGCYDDVVRSCGASIRQTRERIQVKI